MTPIDLVVPVAGGVEEWIQRVDRRTADIGIVGLGYVGLPLALLFSEERFRVRGFDIDETKVSALNEGSSYIHRIEPEHIRAAQKNGFGATADFAEISRMDAILICVPTPLHEDHTPDETYGKLAALLDFARGPEYGAEREGDVRDSLADISAARDALGYVPAVSFEEGLRRTVAWYRENFHV